MMIDATYQAWLNLQGMPQSLVSQLQAMEKSEVEDSFYRDLAFGTGGLRGVLGAGTNRMNVYTVSKATRGLGRYLKTKNAAPSCAVSYDSRRQSKEFAELTAATLASKGIQVYLYQTLMPTPMLSFAVRRHHCDGGVMVTASHNPAKYNGYKVYGANGCQITLEAADEIQAYIDEEPTLIAKLPDFEQLLQSGQITYIGDDTVEAYYQAVSGLRVRRMSQLINVVYSPLNGTGNVPVREMLERMTFVEVDVVPEQESPNENFPTCPYPNPEIPETMHLSCQMLIENQGDICLATDPDCDRVGVGVRVGNHVTLLSGNDIGVLLLNYLCANKETTTKSGLPMVAVKTIVTTDMAKAICDDYGVELLNVLTGFKFIGEQIGLLEALGQEDRYLFGFEESYGYLSGTAVRDKDGVNAAMLICEMAADYKSQGLTLLDGLEQLKAKYGHYGQRLLTFAYEGQRGKQQMDAIMAAFRSPLHTIATKGKQILKRIDYLHDDTGLPASDVISLSFQHNQKAIVRPSGTEAKLKVYLFAKGPSDADAAKALDALEAMMKELC